MILICIGISFCLISAIAFCLSETEKKEWRTIRAPRVKTIIKLGDSR